MEAREHAEGTFDLALACAGDERAVAAMFRVLHPVVLRYVRSQEPRVADDIVAEVWLAVAGGLGRFEGDHAGLRAWIFSIARRRVMDHRRVSARRRTDVVDADTFADAAAVAETDGIALDRMSAQDATALVSSLLEPMQAEVVLLRVLGDLDAEQIGQILNRSPNWVRVTQHRAFRRLALRLGSQFDVMPRLSAAI